VPPSIGSLDLVTDMVARGATDFEQIAIEAARSGYTAIVDYGIGEMERRTPGRAGDAIDLIAASAAQGGHRQLVLESIQLGADNFDQIAKMAARYGYSEIVLDMVELGATALTDIAIEATAYNYPDIVDELVEIGITDHLPVDVDKIAFRAALFGREDIVFDMIERGASNFAEIGAASAIWAASTLSMP